MSVNIFEQASRIGLTFEAKKGRLDVFDLWIMPLVGFSVSGVSLNELAVALHLKLSDNNLDFVGGTNSKSKEDTLNELRFEIVKHVIGVRLAEQKTNQERAALKSQRAAISKALATREEDVINNETVDNLRIMLSEIDAKL